jgi:hypothetical protein
MQSASRQVLTKLTGYGWVVLLLGLGMLAFAGYSQFKASGGHAYVARDQLSTTTGKVLSAAVVTETTKRHGNSHVSDRYYQLEVKPSSGEAQKLRVDLSVGQHIVREIIDEEVSILADKDDKHLVYEIKMGDEVLVPYETSKNRIQAQAEKQAAFTGNIGYLIFCVVLAFTGGGLMFANRKLRATQLA